jgi:hypothetical protein
MRRIFITLLLLLSPLSLRAASLPDPVEFSVAIEVGNIDKAREWLEAGLAPDFEGRTIGTGLMIAAWEGNIPLMELFLAHGADINKANALGEQALLHAAWKGRLDAVRWLVERGARLDRQGKEWAALHYAAFAGHAEVVAYLLERGADVNALSTNGSTPLMMAAREGKEEIASRLLEAGARGDIANERGDTAMTWAVRNNNLRIAQQIAGTDFQKLASQIPPHPTPVIRSQPVSDQADKLLSQARRLESFGRFTEAAKLYRDAFSNIRRADKLQMAKTRKAEQARPVSGLVITARRGDPTAQTAGLQYQTLATQPTEDIRKVGVTGGNSLVGAGATAPADLSAVRESAAEAWLRQAREHEAAGRKREALMAYRQASAALRSR